MPAAHGHRTCDFVHEVQPCDTTAVLSWTQIWAVATLGKRQFSVSDKEGGGRTPRAASGEVGVSAAAQGRGGGMTHICAGERGG